MAELFIWIFGQIKSPAPRRNPNLPPSASSAMGMSEICLGAVLALVALVVIAVLEESSESSTALVLEPSNL